MKSERKQISLKMSTWHRIRALADAEEHDCFMGEMMARIVDDWCVANGWRFTEVHRPGWADKLTAKKQLAPTSGSLTMCGGSLDTPATAR